MSKATKIHIVVISAEYLTVRLSNKGKFVYCVCAKFLVSFHKTNEWTPCLFDWDRKQNYYHEL